MVLLAYCCVAQCLAIWLIMENWLFISVSIVIANSVALFLPLTLKKTFILHLPTKGAELHLKIIKKNIIDVKCSNTQIGRMHKNSAQSSTPCRKYVFSVKLELRMGLSFKKASVYQQSSMKPRHFPLISSPAETVASVFQQRSRRPIDILYILKSFLLAQADVTQLLKWRHGANASRPKYPDFMKHSC